MRERGHLAAATKRGFDVVVAGLALLLVTPLFVALAVAVRFDSSGAAFYRQTRVGRGGRTFTLLKFRSMVLDADRLAANITPAGDPRVTRVGCVLRRWYLDELPQLLNIVKGDMSLVGPRPETPEFMRRYTPDERRILSIRPGLCGPSTLAFMDEECLLAGSSDAESYYVEVVLHQRAAADLTYFDHRSLRGDVAILVRQLRVIVGQRSARADIRRIGRRMVVISMIVTALAGVALVSLGRDLLAGRGSGFLIDNLAHASVYAALSLLLLVLVVPAGFTSRWGRVVAVALALALFGGAIEVAQGWVGRDSEWRDLVADVIGICLGVSVWAMARASMDRRRARDVPREGARYRSATTERGEAFGAMAHRDVVSRDGASSRRVAP